MPRSFYLEMLTRHLIDELLARVGLNRANLGGGRVPAAAQHGVRAEIREANDWLLHPAHVFIATGSCRAANDLRRPNESANNRTPSRYSGSTVS